jgi:pimeloyl-ACP methyl ester carboxylesterase
MWEPLRAALGRDDVVAPDLPFAAGGPKESYVAWLVAELEAAGEPVDLVGHDWGAMLAARAASTRPDLVRTLAIGSGPVDEGYTWHDTAQLWQTPEVGEQVMAEMKPELMQPFFESEGFPADLAATETDALTDEVKAGILALYRSAVEVGREWGPGLEGFDRPAVVLAGVDDAYVPVETGERMATRLGARFVPFEGCGHWWPVARADEAAAELRRLWDSA